MKVCLNILICMWIGVIHGAVHANGTFVLTSSPLTATDGELFTLICSIRNGSAVNIGWLQNNKSMVVSQNTPNCSKQQLAYGVDIIQRINVSCSTTAHSMTFRFNSTTDQGSAWQCGNSVNDSYIYPRSNVYIVGTEKHANTSSHVMSTRSLSTTTQNMETASDLQTVSTKNAFTDEHRYVVVGAVGGAVLLTVVVLGVVCIRRRRKAAHQQEERNNETSPVHQNTTGNDIVENDLYEGSRDVQPMNAAENQEDDLMLSDAYASVDMPVTNTCLPREEVPSGDVNLENLSPDYQNTTGCDTVDNDLYEGSRDVQPMNAAENQEADLMLSDAYASVDMPVTNTCPPREEVPSGDVNLENLYAKPDKSKHTEVQHVSDIYAEVQKPKKKKQDPMVSEV